jgi:bifunctional ADP-heptose synthase (sugar kinase/adenylyltransferase)
MKVLVIGDSCIDKFVYCNIERICPEAPVPVMNPIRESFNPGMASNVVKNLESLGVFVSLETNNEKISKIRYVDNRSGQMVVRIDENDRCNRGVFNNINFSNYDAIVISDYCKGFLTEEDIKYISSKHPLTFLDTKKQLGDWCNDISFIKINEFEHKKNFEILPNYPQIQNKLIVTRGKEGCEYMGEKYPVPPVSVKDVSGAGDTFLSGLVSKYLETKDIVTSLKFANKCATQVVQLRGVAVI